MTEILKGLIMPWYFYSLSDIKVCTCIQVKKAFDSVKIVGRRNFEACISSKCFA